MKEWPDAFWGLLFILSACATAVAALYSHSSNAASVITLGSSIATGTFGFITGKQVGKNSVQIPLDGAQATSKTTVETTLPKEP